MLIHFLFIITMKAEAGPEISVFYKNKKIGEVKYRCHLENRPQFDRFKPNLLGYMSIADCVYMTKKNV
jgi:hypothetical protein